MRVLKDEGSTMLHCSVSMIMIILAVIMTMYVYDTNLVSMIKTQIENDLEIANLSAATIDTGYYTDTGEFQFIEANQMFNDFMDIFQTNMGVAHQDKNILQPTENSCYDGIISEIAVCDFIVYDVEGNNVIIEQYNESAGKLERTVLDNSDSSLHTPDGAQVTGPTVYSKVSVTMVLPCGLPGGITKTVTRENTVAVIIDQGGYE